MKSIKKVASILSIVMCSYATMFLVTIVMNEFEVVRNSGITITGSWYRVNSTGYVFALFGTLLSIAIIVLSCMFCNKKKTDTGIAVALLALIIFSILALISLAGANNNYYDSSIQGLALLYTLVMMGIIVLITVYLIMLLRNKGQLENSAGVSATVSAAVVSGGCRLDTKVTILKQLKDEGTITDAEYKKRVLEIIDTN